MEFLRNRDVWTALAGQFPDDSKIEEDEEDNTPAYFSEKIQMVKMINNRLEALGDWLAGVISEKEYEKIVWDNRLANRQKNIIHPMAINHQSVSHGEWGEWTEYVFSKNPEIAKKEKENLDYWNETLAYAARNWYFCS